jgi:hypothetical protein
MLLPLLLYFGVSALYHTVGETQMILINANTPIRVYVDSNYSNIEELSATSQFSQIDPTKSTNAKHYRR